MRIYKREKYLNKIRPFYHSDLIKVITGIRRCGKSCILKMIIDELKDYGINENNIIFIPLDKRGFKNIKTPEQLEEKIDSLIKDDLNKYIFIDEVQNVKGFEKIIHQYQEEGWSIFLTGSNSYLLSDEISTKLTGRYLRFEVFTLDFKEYLEMKHNNNQPINDNLKLEFEEFVKNGGFPKSLEFDDLSSREFYTSEIVNEIIDKDVKTRKRIMNIILFDKVKNFILNNYSSTFSLENIMLELEKYGYNSKKKTIKSYINELEKAKIIYECKRFDVKSKEIFKKEQKYYLADMSLFFSLNVDNRINFGPSLENLVYLYFVSNGYSVSIGKIGKFECDFIVRSGKEKYAYIQVTYTLQGGNEDTTNIIKEREYRPFRSIKDGFPRYIISLDDFRDQQEGVHHINAIDLFLGNETI